jgi:hypothetical protein
MIVYLIIKDFYQTLQAIGSASLYARGGKDYDICFFEDIFDYIAWTQF